MKEFWSDRIRSAAPYVPGEQPKDRKFIKLNTNENPYPPSPKAVEAMRQAAGEELRLYPDPACTGPRAAAARRFGLTPEQVFVGNGSDEVLAFAFQAFFNSNGKPIVFADVTYSFYPVYAAYFQIPVRISPLRADYTLNTEDFLGDNGGVVLANPNAPTGIAPGLDAIRRILDANPDVVVLVDEAYVDFGAESAVPLIQAYPNLLVVQTLSKSRALAGLRVGLAMGHENLIQALCCVRDSINSYPVDRIAQAGAAAALEDGAWFEETRRRIIAARERAALRLRGLGFTVLPSCANLIFIRHPDRGGRELLDGLREWGILARWFDQPRTRDWLRVSIGTDEEMDALCAALEELTK